LELQLLNLKELESIFMEEHNYLSIQLAHLFQTENELDHHFQECKLMLFVMESTWVDIQKQHQFKSIPMHFQVTSKIKRLGYLQTHLKNVIHTSEHQEFWFMVVLHHKLLQEVSQLNQMNQDQRQLKQL
jgi:hypothetical protein